MGIHPQPALPRTNDESAPVAVPSFRILVVDDHSIVLDGISLLIDAISGMKVVGCVGNGTEAVDAAQRLRPDVILMDLVLPELNGIDATQKIQGVSPETAVIVLSACHTAEHLYRALRAGARGYVLKTVAAGELKQAIQTVTSGRRYISESLLVSLGPHPLQDAFAIHPMETLSQRERAVLRCIADGATSAEIAAQLFLSCKTVESYRSRMMTKLGVTSRSELIRVALRFELPEP